MTTCRVGLGLSVLLLLLFTVATASAELRPVFGVKPGVLIQSSYFGVQSDRLQPFMGLDMVAVAVSEEDYDASASVWIPHLGAKLFLRDPWQEGKIAPYIQGDYFFSVASVKVDDYSTEEEDLVDDVLEFWGLGLAFGAEYYFSDQFSVGGEYGLRILMNSVAEHSTMVDYGGGYSYEDHINDEFSVAFRMNYAAISANYHF